MLNGEQSLVSEEQGGAHRIAKVGGRRPKFGLRIAGRCSPDSKSWRAETKVWRAESREVLTGDQSLLGGEQSLVGGEQSLVSG
jgi:hypothetical protein